MKKTLIVYYSNTGTAEKLAMHIKKLLPDADIDRIGYKGRNYKRHSMISALFKVPGKPQIEGDTHDPSGYERMILIFPIWAGAPAPVMRSYIGKYSKTLPAYSMVCVGAGEDNKAGEWLVKHTGKQPSEKLELTKKKADADDYNLTRII